MMLFVCIFAAMKTNNVFLLLNGEQPNKLPVFSNYEIICATDGAYQYLLENNIKPHFISGDFDSLEALPKEIEAIETPDQNFTDFDKILQILFDKGHSTIDVFGASGKEQDHFLGNLNTAIEWEKKLKITFFDNHGSYFLADKKTVLQNCKHKTISLVPFPKAKEITTKGLQYPLNNENLAFGKRIGTRNKAIENEVAISFTSGNLFIFIND
jgi:thiamine pyrophosphokinase